MLAMLALPLFASLPGPTTVYLTELDLAPTAQQVGRPKKDQNSVGGPIRIAGREFARGLGTHAPGELIVETRGATRFAAWVGMDDAAGKGKATFEVVGDGNVLWSSLRMAKGDPAVRVEVDLAGVRHVVLRTRDGGDGHTGDLVDWAEAAFVSGPKPPRTVDVLPAGKGRINPGKRWFDTQGRPIQAHSAGILLHEGVYYWYGEERTRGYFNHVGVACYSSRDLVKWKSEGIAMPSAAFPTEFREQGVCERAKVVYNRRTGKFVLWAHLDANGYRVSEAGVAVADRPTGPFRFVSRFRPIPGSTYRDMNLFVDDDGSAYALYAGEDNATLHIVRLSDDYLSPQTPMVEGKTWARALVNQWREAPAPFKHRGRYYMATSGCTGWAPNEADLATAPSMLGPWESLGNPCIGLGAETTFGSQSTFVLPLPQAGPDWFVFMADRWNPQNLEDSRYVWLPFRMGEGRPEIAWRDHWDPRRPGG